MEFNLSEDVFTNTFVDEQIDNASDEEIFFGELSIKELKKHIFLNKATFENSETKCFFEYDLNGSDNDFIQESDTHENDSTIKITEGLSQLNLSRDTIKNITLEAISPICNANMHIEDSFLRIEKMVKKLGDSPRNSISNEKLNNTLEVVEYILKNDNKYKHKDKEEILQETEDQTNGSANEKIQFLSVPNHLSKNCDPHLDILPNTINSIDNMQKTLPDQHNKTPDLDTGNVAPKTVKAEIEPIIDHQTKGNYSNCKILTPDKGNNRALRGNKFATPAVVGKSKIPAFKTPAQWLFKKTPASSLKRTPSKINTYQHVMSPVALYIKQCPETRLQRHVHPNTPSPSTTSFPKLSKASTTIKQSNKENVNLRSVGYKITKKTEIKTPHEEKRPPHKCVKGIKPLA